MNKKNVTRFYNFTHKSYSVSKIIIPILLFTLLFAVLITPLRAQLTPARDLTGSWSSGVSGMYYDMDPSDPTARMNDITATFAMDITQQGSQISITLTMNIISWVTDNAYFQEWGMNGVPPVGGGSIYFVGTVSGASFSADEYPASSFTQEHIAGTFTSDIITATLTGNSETTDTNGIVVIRSGSSATVPPIATPAPAPALPTVTNLGSVSQVQGSVWFADTGAAVTAQSQIGTGSEIKTGSDSIVSFSYPDQGGEVYLGANSDAGWVYLEPQINSTAGTVSYSVVPSPATGTVPFEQGLESDEFGQVAVTLPIEIGIGILILGETLPVALTGAAVVEGTLLLASGAAYIHEQLSPQQGTCDMKPVQIPQGLLMGSGTDYQITVTNGTTTVQVISGFVIYVDQYTNSSITLAPDQVLTLPAGVSTGFSQQELLNNVSIFDPTSINQWWLQTATTSTPPSSTTTTPTPNNSSGFMDFLSQPEFLAPIILIVVIVIVAVLATTRRKTHSKQPNQKSINQNMAQPATYETAKTTVSTTETPVTPPAKPNAPQPKLSFCPNCGNQLLKPQEVCPFCGSNLSQWNPTVKK